MPVDEEVLRGGVANAGDPGFVKMWAEIGGMERFDRRRRWWSAARPRFEAALR